MCKLLEESDESPPFRSLAKHVGLSESHAHRLFVRTTGLTPKHYRDAVMRRRTHEHLTASSNVTEAIYSAGFSSKSPFYERVVPSLGMKLSQYRNGAQGAVIRFGVGQCTLGSILVAAATRGVCAVLLGDAPDALVRDLEDRFPRANLVGGDSEFERLMAEVIGRIDSDPRGRTTELPLDIQGTVFQERVWRALLKIPRGETTTYGQIAAAMGAPQAARAVARACADNRIGVLIPCHRVVHSDGTLSGYRWGIDRKRELLRREGSGAQPDESK
jgi:AraC family transcriptional regulator, regulatory protein of adaptative response / methylated-DNA-[protein]-cysteine methyltransferase